MRPAGHGLDDLCLVAGGEQLVAFARLHVAELEAGPPLDDQELLGLRMVVVPAAGDPRMRGKERELAAIRRLQHLDEHAAGVAVLRHRVGEGFLRQVADVGRIQRPDQPAADALGHQGIAAFPEGTDQAGQFADGGRILRRHRCKPLGRQLRIGTVHQLDETRHHVVDVDQRDRCRRIVDLDRQIAGDVVAEGGDRRVVVRPAPLAEHVGQAEQIDGKTVLRPCRAQRLFGRQLALTVRIVALGLDRRRIDHGNGLAALAHGAADRGAQRARQVGIAGHEFLRILRTIHPGQVEHEIDAGQLGRQIVHAVRTLEADNLDVAPLGQEQLQVLADEAGRPGDQHLHRLTPRQRRIRRARSSA